jgi:hypothetical protein
MEGQTAPKSAWTTRVRSQRFRAGAVIVLAVAVGLILWLALRGNGNSSSSSTTNPAATAASQADITSLANSLNHPVYWVGSRTGITYELTHQPNGTVIVRYLPNGATVGSSSPYLSVATYPFPGAYGALKGVKASDVVFVKLAHGGIAEFKRSYPSSVHVAWPNVNYQVEVYDPTPGQALDLVKGGAVAGLGPAASTTTTTTAAAPPAKPKAATAADLTALAHQLGHSIYWVGPKNGETYELTNASNGNVYVRYLPPGVAVGSSDPYLSVATYPFPKAYAATKGLTKQANMQELKVPDGGVAVVNKGYPQSIHLAYPGSDYQIEVFDPSAAKVRALVTSGQVQAIG